jgi:mxaD protein
MLDSGPILEIAAMPNIIRSLVFTALAALCVPAFAAGPPPTLKVSKSVTIHAAPEVVWAKIGDFNGLNTWHPAVAKVEIVAGVNNEIGAERLLTLGPGGTIREKLLGFDARHHRYRYSIIEGVLPVSEYSSTISVKGAGQNRSKVTWSGSFKRKHHGAHPPAGEDDAAATKAISEVYQSGLDNLKKIIEKK